MTKLAWKPWHQVVQLRPELKSGDLSLSSFAADLYDVMLGRKKTLYTDPADFFALTYPTFALRELARDVIARLAGQSDKAVRQLELTYGGGKTHTLVTLYHLVNDPEHLPDLPAVETFIKHCGITPPRTRVAVLPFDKLDVEKGMEVRSPSGEIRWLKNPWSVIAFQLAGAEGLRLLHAEGHDAERESAPAENLLVDLLALPARDGLSTLVLVDEVLMFAREKVGLDPAWRSRLVNFFQYLTQAVVKVDRCAMVASLLATDPGKSDTLGKEIMQEISAIFGRQREESVQPVQKDDVAEVLRRRFFTPVSISSPELFEAHVVDALKGIAALDEQTQKEGKLAEDRYRKSYPFHPELTEIFYGKWTQLEGFQRTRGILRTFALALRDAVNWDNSPLIGANVFLGSPLKDGLSEAARELANVAANEQYEGKKYEWFFILESELVKAREIQRDFPGLKHREAEQAVFATFLHSQPVTQKAQTRDLLTLLGHTRPDRIELEKALRRWADTSWYLDEAEMAMPGAGADGSLPKAWRMGFKPNLKQMHHAALTRVGPELVETKLTVEIEKTKNRLTAGVSAAGGTAHLLPGAPKDVADDGDFHFAVLGAKAASESGKPSAEARRFLEEKTGPEAPRVNRNAVVLAVPSRDGIDLVRERIREYLAWEEVKGQLADQDLDPNRQAMLLGYISEARGKIPEAITQAYCIVVTVNEKNDVQAFRLAVTDGALFAQIKADDRARIQDTAINAEALLPEGPYDLWREGETAHRVKNLVLAFSQRPHLPKMVNSKAILDTLMAACEQGLLVVRAYRPDKSFRTFWRETPDENAMKDPAAEVVLPEAATLSDIPVAALVPGRLPELWTATTMTVKALYEYFAGGHVVQVQKEGYTEPLIIPKAERTTVDVAVQAAVREAKLWLTVGPASIYGEEIPAGLLTEDAVLQAPPKPVSPADLLAESLPEAWKAETPTVLALAVALGKKVGANLPWSVVRTAVDSALKLRMLERTPDAGPWPCDYAGAHLVKVRVPAPVGSGGGGVDPVAPPPVVKTGLVAEAELQPSEIQDLADQVGELKKAAAGLELKFTVRLEISGPGKSDESVVAKLNDLLKAVSDQLQLK
jgi:hypothetical protein